MSLESFIIAVFFLIVENFNHTFGKQRVHYCGVVKNQFAAFMEGTCFNLKRLTILGSPGLNLNCGDRRAQKRLISRNADQINSPFGLFPEKHSIFCKW
jgi:hypothetical protein